MKLNELFARARKLSRDKHKAGEQEKIGNLRAGTSGIISPDGDVAGSCIRKAHVRQLGIELEEITEDKLIMFDLGFANEDVIYDKLVRALPEGHKVLREEEIPIEWTTTNGTKVTGRPDIVILRKASFQEAEPWPGQLVPLKPILGLELKSVHSIWTARDVLFGGKPKLSNVIQAAHYMWKLDVPYKLIYTAYSQLGQGMAGKDDWISKQFPKPGQPLSEYVEYNPKGQIKHIRQFEIVYDLRFDERGVVQYRIETADDSRKWESTIVTRDGIAKFFEATSKLPESKVLGPRPTQIDLIGGKASYSDCNYCSMKLTCDKFESKGYDTWLSEVKKLELK